VSILYFQRITSALKVDKFMVLRGDVSLGQNTVQTRTFGPQKNEICMIARWKNENGVFPRAKGGQPTKRRKKKCRKVQQAKIHRIMQNKQSDCYDLCEGGPCFAHSPRHPATTSEYSRGALGGLHSGILTLISVRARNGGGMDQSTKERFVSVPSPGF